MAELSESTKKQRRAYGRGMYEGLRLAGVTNPENVMNAAKLATAEQAQTSIARKVLQAVSPDHSMSVSKIVGELRSRGNNTEVSIISGCLNTLKDAGLIREPRCGEYVRTVARDRPALVVSETSTPSPITEAQPAPAAIENGDALGRMARVAQKARVIADQVRELSSEIEEVAIGVEEQIQKIHADNAKLEQLKAILKSIS